MTDSPGPKKRHILRNTLIAVAVMVVIGIIAGAVGSGDKDAGATVLPVAAVPTASTVPPQWVEVSTLSGSGDQVGDAFTLAGGKCRITYTINKPKTMPILTIYIMEEGKYLDSDGGFPEVMMVEESGTSTFTKQAGSYYLDVSGANCSWAVTVEEWK